MRPDTLDEYNPQADTPTVADLAPFEYEIEPEPVKKPTPNWLSGGRGVILGIGLGALLTFGATRLISRPQTAQTPALAAPKTSAPAQSVTVASVKTTLLDRTLKATGTVTAYELIPILSQATGLQIQQILVDEGDIVRAGQLLARLDDSVLQAQFAQATASVAQSEARLAELRAGARKEEIDRAKSTIRRIEAEIRQVRSDWDLAKKRVQRNRGLEAEGAIAKDRLDEVLNEERNKEAIVQQALARLTEAKQQLAQLEAGTRTEVIAQAIAELAEAKSRLQIVRAQLDYTRIISPISGKISERTARVGDTTNGQTALFKIIENGRLEVRLKVPEAQLTSIKAGQSVAITSDAAPDLQLSGRVREINPVVDEESRQAMVKVDIPTVNLKPGMFLRGTIVTNSVSSLTVPMEAILPKNDNNATVYLIKPDNTVESRSVTLGQIMAGNQAEILSGLKAGDRIVVKGAVYLNDGDKITF